MSDAFSIVSIEMPAASPGLRAVPLDEFSDGVIVGPWPLFDVSVLRTADFAGSSSGNARTRFGNFQAQIP